MATHFTVALGRVIWRQGKTCKCAVAVALVLATVVCGTAPGASNAEVRTPTPALLPTSFPDAPEPAPIPLTDLTGMKVVELGSDFRPTDLSGDRALGIGREGEVYVTNVRTGEVRQLTNDGSRKS